MPRARTATAPASGANAFDELVNSSAVTMDKPKGKKSNDPIINLSEATNPALLNFIAKKAEMKNAESVMREHEQVIFGEVMPQIDELNLNKSEPATTWLINGKQSNGQAIAVKLVMSDKFSLSNDPAILKALQDELGDDYSECVVEDTTISIKPEVMENPELKKEFMALIQSGDNFRKFFMVEKKSIAKKGLLDKIWKIAKSTDRLAKLQTYLVRAKAALK